MMDRAGRRTSGDKGAEPLRRPRIEESNEDCLYPEDYFVAVEFPRQAERALVRRVSAEASNLLLQPTALTRRRWAARR